MRQYAVARLDTLNRHVPAIRCHQRTRRKAIEVARWEIALPPRVIRRQDNAVGDLAAARGAPVDNRVELPEGPHGQRVRVGRLGVASGVVGGLHGRAKDGLQPARRVRLGANPGRGQARPDGRLELLQPGAALDGAGDGLVHVGDQLQAGGAGHGHGLLPGLRRQFLVRLLGHGHPSAVPGDGVGRARRGRRGHGWRDASVGVRRETGTESRASPAHAPPVQRRRARSMCASVRGSRPTRQG